MIYQPFDKRLNEIDFHIERLGCVGSMEYNMVQTAHDWMVNNTKFSIPFLIEAYHRPPKPLYHLSSMYPQAYYTNLKREILNLLKQFTEEDNLSFEQLRQYRTILTSKKTKYEPA